MTPEGYPALFSGSDRASTNAQRKYLRLRRTHFWLLLAAAGVTMASTFVHAGGIRHLFPAIFLLL